MPARTYSGDDVVTVLVNHGPFYVDRINGSHAILKWEPPAGHDSSQRTVVVPRHDTIATGTLRNIGEQAGMKRFTRFCEWLDRNL